MGRVLAFEIKVGSKGSCFIKFETMVKDLKSLNVNFEVKRDLIFISRVDGES